MHFDATLAFCALAWRSLLHISSNPMHNKKHLAWVLLPFSILIFKQPFVLLRYGALSSFALPSTVSLSRFGYLLSDVSHLNLGNASFPTLLGFYPSKLYSFSMIEKKFPSFLPLLRFSPRPAGFGSALQRFNLIEKAVPLLATSNLFRSRANCSHRLITSRAFSPTKSSRRHLHSSKFPSRSWS